MHKYETLFVLHVDLPDAQVRETIDRARRLVEGMEGEDVEAEEWGARDMAYMIEKQSRGIYVLLRYTSTPEVVRELERTFKLADEVLRFVTVRVPKIPKSKAKATDTDENKEVAEAASEEASV